jgi:hypothetical protein
MAAHFARGGTTGAPEAGAGRPRPRTGLSQGLPLEEKVTVGYRCENDRLLQSMLKQSREAIKRSQALLLLRVEPFLARMHRDIEL